jgi:hypothetical protein
MRWRESKFEGCGRIAGPIDRTPEWNELELRAVELELRRYVR